MPSPSTVRDSSLVGVLFAAVGVRLLLISHNVLTTWRVVLTYYDVRYWALVFTNILTISEGVVVIRKNRGIEWKWKVFEVTL